MKTSDELFDEFLIKVREIAEYWAKVGDTKQEACEGVAFSILALIDGVRVDTSYPLTLVVDIPEKEMQKELHIKDGTEINKEKYLHDFFYKHSKDV